MMYVYVVDSVDTRCNDDHQHEYFNPLVTIQAWDTSFLCMVEYRFYIYCNSHYNFFDYFDPHPTPLMAFPFPPYSVSSLFKVESFIFLGK